MRIIMIAIIVGILLLDAFMFYCLMRAESKDERWMEQHPLSKERFEGKGKDPLQ